MPLIRVGARPLRKKCAILCRENTHFFAILSRQRNGRLSRSMQPEDLEKLLVREMPYGKYKGHRMADLPGHYLGWFAREGFPKGEIGQLLALMYELDHNNLRGLLDPLRRGEGGSGKVRSGKS